MTTPVDFETIERPDSPNTYLLAPEGLCKTASVDEPSPSFDATPRALFDRVEALVGSYKNWSTETRDEAQLQLDLIAKTKLLKFKDDVAIRVLPDSSTPEKSRLAIYSRSRVGYSDLGANRKRVQSLVAALKEKG